MNPNNDIESSYRHRFRVKVGTITFIILLPLTILLLYPNLVTILSTPYYKGVVTSVDEIDTSASVNYDDGSIKVHLLCSPTRSHSCPVSPGDSIGFFKDYYPALKEYQGKTLSYLALGALTGILLLILTVVAIVGLFKPPQKSRMDKFIRF